MLFDHEKEKARQQRLFHDAFWLIVKDEFDEDVRTMTPERRTKWENLLTKIQGAAK